MSQSPGYPWRPRWNVGHSFRILLRVLRFPFLLPLLSFLVIFHNFTQRWCAKFDCGGIWQPAFPNSWRAWALGLLAASLNSAIWLVWLLGWEAAMWCMRWRSARLWRSSRRYGLNGSPRLSEEEDGAQYILLPDGERASSPPTSPASPTRRKTRRRLPTMRAVWWWIQIVLYASLAFAGLWEVTHYEHPHDVRFRPSLRQALTEAHPKPGGYSRGEKIFIAAAFSQNEAVLPYWTATMLSVIAYLGSSNVFVSIVESHSSDATPVLLIALADTLAARGVRHRILVRDDDAIEKPEDLSFNNRINFLAAIRNRVLEPLIENGGYDRVLFSNDVFIEPESVIELLETNGGEYDVACAMDFNHFGAYDAWVLRDRLGHLTSTIWPYFIDAPSIELMREDSPVPAFACWNGMIVFSADPLLPIPLRSNRTLSTSPLSRPLPSTHPATRHPSQLGPSPALTPPLRFRAADRDAGECFSSESFLLPYDFRRVFDLQRIYVNPRVVTSYGWHFYVWFKWVLGHRLVRWWVREVYDGWGMERAKMVVGGEESVWVWDGGDCHPWW